MAFLDDLVSQIPDVALRGRLQKAITDLRRKQKFGLVFEEHIPETTAIFGLPIEVGTLVQRRQDSLLNGPLRVRHLIDGGKTAVLIAQDGREETVAVADLLVVKRFGEPMYATLKPVDRVKRGPEARPYHAVVNGENFHALQLFTYLYERSVDCIYIDPPYNTGAKDWKYNNRFVDSNDAWRHSKWLAMMEKRLRLAKRLLKPDGVLVVMIDEHELHHLGMLLERSFPEADRQMVTIVTNPKGVARPGTVRFARVEEYALFCFLGNAGVTGRGDDLLTGNISEDDPQTDVGNKPRWPSLLRSGTNARRQDRANMFYPVLIDAARGAVVGVGEPLLDGTPDLDEQIHGYSAAWPIRSDNSFGNWGVGHTTLSQLIEKGFVSVGTYDPRRRTWPLSYLSQDLRAQLAAGILDIVDYDPNRNVVDVRYTEEGSRRLKTVWHRTRHDAGVGGSDVLRAFLGSERLFDFPKSVYAVRDVLSAVVGSRPDALILDFFAGSGTTLHSTCLLNAIDGGTRRCILVTNNEVDEKTAAELERAGHYRGDREFESMGIFERVTAPRVKAAVTGRRSDGFAPAGKYKSPENRSFSAGFDENVEFYELQYLDPDDVELGEQFQSIHPLLWLAAGGIGEREEAPAPGDYYIAPASPYGVLFKPSRLSKFLTALENRPNITHVWIVTDSEQAYAEACEALPCHVTFTSQLYRDYLRTFRVNARRF